MRRYFVVLALIASYLGFALTPALAAGQSVIFVVDTSGSMKGKRIAAAQEAVRTIAKVMPEDVALGLVTFSSRPTLRVKPSLAREALEAGVANMVADGETALYDGVILGYKAAQGASDAVVIVITDGEDTASRSGIPAVASRDWSATQLSVVSIDRPSFSVIRSEFQSVVQSSGGLLISVADISLLTEALLKSLEKSGIVPLPLPTFEPLVVEQLTARKGLAPWGLAGLVGITVLAAALAIYLNLSRLQVARSQRLVMEHYAGAEEEGVVARAIPIPKILSQPNAWLPPALDSAGLEITPIKFRQYQFGLWLGTVMVLLVFGLPLFLVLLIAGGVGSLLPRRVLARLLRRRQEAFQAELPDFLSIAASALRAGLPLSQAIESAARESSSELGRQMKRVLQEVSIGSSLDVAMRKAADRMRSEDFSWLVTAIEVQRRIGGNLSEILDLAADTVRSRLELRQEVKTLASEGLLSAKVLTALPLGLLAFLALGRREFVSPLWETGAGLVVLSIAGTLMVLGYQWIKRLARLEV